MISMINNKIFKKDELFSISDKERQDFYEDVSLVIKKFSPFVEIKDLDEKLSQKPYGWHYSGITDIDYLGFKQDYLRVKLDYSNKFHGCILFFEMLSRSARNRFNYSISINQVSKDISDKITEFTDNSEKLGLRSFVLTQESINVKTKKPAFILYGDHSKEDLEEKSQLLYECSRELMMK